MRIAVLSDIHANLPALDAVLSDAGAVDGIWHLGDVVGYGPDPDGVVARLRDAGAIGVRGNHDAAAAGGSEIDWFNPDARRAMEWTRSAISPATVEWLRGLPERRAVEGCELVHGSFREPMWEYVTSAEVAGDSLSLIRARIGLHGHTHVPIAWLEREGHDDPIERVEPRDGSTLSLDGARALVNPGSVGQPRDGDQRASYLILDPGAGAMSWHRVDYNIGAVQAAMRRAGLPGFLISRLSVGF